MLYSDLSQYTHEQLSNFTYEQLSNFTYEQLELMGQMKLITDRTLADVDRWKELRDKGWANMSEAERREWMGEINVSPSAAKGMYTHNDLNRVESAVGNIVKMLEKSGIDVPKMVIKTDWTYRDKLLESDVERYFSNISVLRGLFDVYKNTPRVPRITDNLTFTLANNIEKILMDVEEIAIRTIGFRYYSGEIFLGEV